MGRRLALVIGNSLYQDSTLAKLKTPDADARALAEILRSQEAGSFDEVQELLNQPEAVVRREISLFFSKKKLDDLLLLYFSGHGVLDDQGRLYLATIDTQRELLNATGISAAFVSENMDACRSKRQILILDCCHSGAFARGTKGAATAVSQLTFESKGSGRVVLTASDSTQYALEGDQIIQQSGLSLFTHHLLNGIDSGQADLNGDGLITLDEWYDFAYDQIVAQTPKQTPKKWVYNQEGELVIARNPHPEIVQPAELPAGLREAIDSQFASVRLGAIADLERLLQSKNVALSLAAYQALKKMATADDSRSVSTAAAEKVAAHEARSGALERTPGEIPIELPAEREAEVEEEKREDSGGLVATTVEEIEFAPEEVLQEAPIPVSSVSPESKPVTYPPITPLGRDRSAQIPPQRKMKPATLMMILGGVGVALITILVIGSLGWGIINRLRKTPTLPVASQPPPAATTEPPLVTSPLITTAPVIVPPAVTDTPIPPPLGGGSGWIAYESRRDGDPEIYLIKLDGSERTRLTYDPAEDSYPVWSPDGTRLLFHSNRESNNYDIYLMNEDGTGLTALTRDARASTFPDWSTDGKRIVFQSKRDGPKQIYWMYADGSNQTRLITDPKDAYLPVWSPDGSRIAFVSERDGNPEIYVMNADGSNPVRLTHEPAEDTSPKWSPDGALIAFVSKRDGDRDIYVMSVSGSEVTRLTSNSVEDVHPAWSPNGKLIAFASKAEGVFEIYVMDRDGSNIQRITSDLGDNQAPAWRP